MRSADLPEAAATGQQNLYTVSKQCAVFVFHHANLRTTGIREAACAVDVSPSATKPKVMIQIRRAPSCVTDIEYAAKLGDRRQRQRKTDR
jgi:hypothetical protein